jgi:hypothetical protein
MGLMLKFMEAGMEVIAAVKNRRAVKSFDPHCVFRGIVGTHSV